MCTKYTAGYVTNNHYIIGNSEYGYELCRVNFFSNISEILTDDELHQLADDMAKLVSDRIEQSEKAKNVD